MGIYLVCWSLETVTDGYLPTLLHAKVEAHQFLAVEEWADSETPDGYFLWSIEKVYHDSAAEMYGETDAVLEEVR